jgi:hypothetical protein
LTEKRLQKTAELLARTSLRIKEIATDSRQTRRGRSRPIRQLSYSQLEASIERASVVLAEALGGQRAAGGQRVAAWRCGSCRGLRAAGWPD